MLISVIAVFLGALICGAGIWHIACNPPQKEDFFDVSHEVGRMQDRIRTLEFQVKMFSQMLLEERKERLKLMLQPPAKPPAANRRPRSEQERLLASKRMKAYHEQRKKAQEIAPTPTTQLQDTKQDEEIPARSGAYSGTHYSSS